jgi:hypothetical protein
MALTVRQITQIAQAITRNAPRLEVQGVIATDGGSERVELLLTIAAADREPRLVLLNVSREGAVAFETELTAKLRDLS